MRVYYVRVTDSEFTKLNGVWTSPVIDLYDNSTYKNFSSTKLGYGQDLLGDGTWTGMELVSPGTTDSGYVQGGRFIDTSGRIDIVSYTFDSDPFIEGLITYNLNVFNTDTLHATPTWATPAYEVPSNDSLNVIEAGRYVYFTLNVSNPQNIDFDGTLLVRIEIDQPVMVPYYGRTRTLQNKFPEWMSMRELDNPATPLGAPLTLGGAFLNVAGGRWLEELASDLSYLDLQKFIGSVDLNQIAWVYRKDRVPQFVWKVEGDGVTLSAAFDLEEFYEAVEDEDIYFWDEDSSTIYVRKLYTWFTINEEEAATPSGLMPHHVWNWLDDLALLVDLNRIELEENSIFQLRILDVHVNKPGVGAENFKKAIRRELDIWSVYGSTPNSSYQGATPIVLEVSDIEKDAAYINPDGLPTAKFAKLVEKLAEEYPSTWGHFYWDQAYWDLGGPNHEGYSTLSKQLDATPLPDIHTQSGVGFGNDLFVYRPDVVTGPRQFSATLKIRGRQKTTRTEHTQVDFDVQVWGTANKSIYTNPEAKVWLTLVAITNQATPKTYYHSFQIAATSDANAVNTSGTDASLTYYDVFDSGGVSHLNWVDADGVVLNNLATPIILTTTNLGTLQLRDGRFNTDTDTYVDTTGSNWYDAWFGNVAATILTNSSGPISATGLTAEPAVVFKSKRISSTVGLWTSEKIDYHITLNGVQPDQTEVDYTLALPAIGWDTALTGTPNKQIHVQIVTYSSAATPAPGAYALGDDDIPFFIDTTYLDVNGNNTWTNATKTFADGTASILFSTRNGAAYPISGTLWSLFEDTQNVPFNGIVDENGPWRNNVVPHPGNTNYSWRVAELERTDFGIPDTTSYVPTWIGVESSDPQVIVWLENNTIVPVDDTSEISYPANAIEEYKDGSIYGLESFIVKARLRPNPGPQWNPQINSGTFFERQQEYYMYAARREAVVVGASSVILDTVAHQGAPIIVYTGEATPKLMRQVAFSDATPVISLKITETVSGTGTNTLYLAYPDVYGVTMVGHHNQAAVAAPASTATNRLVLGFVTDRDELYDVSYTLNNSFYAEMNYDHNGVKKTRLVFDQSGNYTVNYEGSILNYATPVDLPLSPLYTTLDEGFVFISHDEYSLDSLQLHLSPSRVKADGNDYIQITIKSIDVWGNPKGDQNFTLATSFGTLDDTTITTDRDGYASALLKAGSTAPNTLKGTLTVTGAMATSVQFDVEPLMPETGRLIAITSAEEVPADGQTKVSIFGKVEDSEFQPRANTTVYYRRGRTIFELFKAAFQGSVVTSSDGTFEVGPFTTATPTDPGYWFVGLETNPATPIHHVGDVVFWNEYPITAYGIDDLSGLPRPANQMATPISAIPPYAVTYQFPFTYDEHSTPVARPPITPVWLPPKWYSLPWYLQYQLGLFGATPNKLSTTYINNARRPREDI